MWCFHDLWSFTLVHSWRACNSSFSTSPVSISCYYIYKITQSIQNQRQRCCWSHACCWQTPGVPRSIRTGISCFLVVAQSTVLEPCLSGAFFYPWLTACPPTWTPATGLRFHQLVVKIKKTQKHFKHFVLALKLWAQFCILECHNILNMPPSAPLYILPGCWSGFPFCHHLPKYSAWLGRWPRFTVQWLSGSRGTSL